MRADTSREKLVELKSLLMNPPPPIARSKRAKTVARWFGLRLPDRAARDETRDAKKPLDELTAMTIASLVPAPGEIVLITGPSGAGKSSLLRAIRANTRGAVRWVDLDRVHIRSHRAVVDLFGRTSLRRVLEQLSRVGLAEVWTYLRKPHELSEGQRWRLKLAMALMRARRRYRHRRKRDSPRAVIVCDEFAALLDRVTACIVAHTLRRAIGADRSALVATSHEDLVHALKPDVIVRCDFGNATIERATYSSPRTRGEAG